MDPQQLLLDLKQRPKNLTYGIQQLVENTVSNTTTTHVSQSLNPHSQSGGTIAVSKGVTAEQVTPITLTTGTDTAVPSGFSSHCTDDHAHNNGTQGTLDDTNNVPATIPNEKKNQIPSNTINSNNNSNTSLRGMKNDSSLGGLGTVGLLKSDTKKTESSVNINQISNSINESELDSIEFSTNENVNNNEITTSHWKPDHLAKVCALCGIGFSFFERRHHCRRCGDILCGNCSSHNLLLNETANPDLVHGKAVRVCDVCFNNGYNPPAPPSDMKDISPVSSTENLALSRTSSTSTTLSKLIVRTNPQQPPFAASLLSSTVPSDWAWSTF